MELAVVILVIPRLTFTCSNSAIEKGVKVNNKNPRKTSSYFAPFSSIF